MRKSKGQTIDLLYTSKEVNKKSKKTKRNAIKNKKTNSRKPKKNNEKIDLDNEIIIGLTPKKEEQKKQTKKKKNKLNKTKNSKKRLSKKNSSIKRTPKNNLQKQNNNKAEKPRKKRSLKFVKWLIIIILFITVVILFMLSDIFNIKEIVVINNSKVSSQEIIELSTLTTGINMFKTTNKKIKSGIKTNAYIEDVSIKRNINGTVTLDIQERTPTYILEFANAYVYINNQGYILEISETPLELPVISGFQTPQENIKAGNRLEVEDLEKLDDVIKIMETAKSMSMADIITKIDISDSSNYKLIIEKEGKTVQFGECSNINIKLLKIKAVMEQEKGVEGEIYFQDSERTIFKEKV